MTLLDSLLDAIVRLDGDALVMHVGEKPYVVLSSAAMNSYRGPVSWGQVELSSRPLTTEAIMGMLGQMLSLELRQTLFEVGAVEHEIEAPGHPGQHFIVTAARGGDDVWVEVRRRPPVVAPAEPEIVIPAAPEIAAAAVLPQAAAGAIAEPEIAAGIAEPEFAAEAIAEPEIAAGAMPVGPPPVEPELAAGTPLAAAPPPPVESPVAAEGVAFELGLMIESATAAPVPDVPELEVGLAPPAQETGEPEPQTVLFQFHRDPQETSAATPISGNEPATEPTAWELAAALVDETTEAWEIMEMPSAARAVDNRPAETEAPSPTAAAVDAGPWAASTLIDLDHAILDVASGTESVPTPVAQETRDSHIRPPDTVDEGAGVQEAAATSQVVMPISRPPLKLQPAPPPPTAAASTEASLVELLRTAVARGASTLYAVAGSRPMLRTDGQIAVLGTEPVIAGSEVERFAFEFAPREQVADAVPQWACTVPGVGRVRCITFRDRDGAGLIFHLPSPNLGTADELGLEPQVKALCDQADGLVVVSGPRGSGKSTLLGAFVDLIGRTRKDHVITIESGLRLVHETRHSFISQREIHGDGEALAAAARAALREAPDVLVIEDLRAPESLTVALDAARAGRLVFGSISAPTASAAVQRLIDAFAAERRPQIQALLSGTLRAVVAQVLVSRPAGGRTGARELLLNSPAVSKLIVEGAIAQLPIAIEGGRRLGMKTMIDSLGALVRDGVIDAAEACRRAPDRAALVAALERDGIDVSGLERRA